MPYPKQGKKAYGGTSGKGKDPLAGTTDVMAQGPNIYQDYGKVGANVKTSSLPNRSMGGKKRKK